MTMYPDPIVALLHTDRGGQLAYQLVHAILSIHTGTGHPIWLFLRHDFHSRSGRRRALLSQTASSRHESWWSRWTGGWLDIQRRD